MTKARLKRPPHLDTRGVALFLDLDGTIAEITALPGDVGPVAPRNRLLADVDRALSGRMAILTGRTLDEADRILGGAITTVAAVHGLVRRTPDGAVVVTEPSAGLPRARAALQELARAHQGLLVEEKGSSIALHYRQAPETEALVREAAGRIARDNELIVQGGSMVSELRTPGPDKGDSLRVLLADSKFSGFMPIMVGDDLTDEHAFEAADSSGGYGVLVGPPRQTHARYGLGSVDEVLEWLRAAVD